MTFGQLRWGILAALLFVTQVHECPGFRFPDATHNLLVNAEFSSNIETFDKGLRGAADHIVFGLQSREFINPSVFGICLKQGAVRYVVGAAEMKAFVFCHDPLFPLNRARRFGADIVNDAIDTRDFVDDPIGDATQ